jgi:hypothetical protein
LADRNDAVMECGISEFVVLGGFGDDLGLVAAGLLA